MCSCTGSCDCNSITVPRGPQGEKGNTGDIGLTGLQGPIGLTGPVGLQGPSGVVNVEAPVTNTGTPTSAIIGVDIDELVNIINTSNTGGGFVPTGAIIGFGASVAPAGWIFCKGDEVSKLGSFAALYAVIGDTYGTPVGIDTFVLPNLKKSVPVGYDFTAPLFNTLGNVGGDLSVTLEETNLPEHTHSNNFAVTGSGSHNHLARRSKIVAAGGAHKIAVIDITDDGEGGRYIIHSEQSDSNGSHTHGISGSIGDGSGTFNSTPFSILQPYLVINYIIKL